MRKTIVIAGATGLIGKELCKLFEPSYNVIKLSRSDINLYIDSKYNSFKDEVICIVNCIYDYKCRGSKENNINYVISKSLYKLKEINNIPYYINISSLSAHSKAISKYGIIKRNIEKYFRNKKGCYSIRLGLPYLGNKKIGLLRKIELIQYSGLFFSFSLGHNSPIYQRISDLMSFGAFITLFLNNPSRHPKIFSFSYDQLYNFNDLINSFSRHKINIIIPVKLLSFLLNIIEGLKIPFIFSKDNLIGLIDFPKKYETKNYE